MKNWECSIWCYKKEGGITQASLYKKSLVITDPTYNQMEQP